MQSDYTEHAVITTTTCRIAGSITRNMSSLVGSVAFMGWGGVALTAIPYSLTFFLALRSDHLPSVFNAADSFRVSLKVFLLVTCINGGFWHGGLTGRSNILVELDGVWYNYAAVLVHCREKVVAVVDGDVVNVEREAYSLASIEKGRFCWGVII
jgi:hypothetical protein